MALLTNKQILVGVTGGIAAYKSAELIRRLQDLGAQVRVCMTPGAQEFITPLTLQALSGNPVYLDLLDPEAEAGMGHIELARWADLVLIAPASADFIARLASGHANDLLSTVCLATPANIAIAPAMNQAMWRNESTQNNIQTLTDRSSIIIWGPDSGTQACGDIGPGRMLDPMILAENTAAVFEPGMLTGKKVIITAGPTREAIDPVRYLTNHSSGKMGYAIAQAAAEAGAYVVLISGPTSIEPPDHVEMVNVDSADQMLEASLKACDGSDIFIAAAAVADYKPVEVYQQKMKKGSEDTLTLNLVKHPDVVATVSRNNPDLFVVGFAAETENIEAYALKKLEQKNLNLIVANDVSDKAIGFNSDENAVIVFDKNEKCVFSQRSKSQLSRDIINEIAKRIRR